MAIRQKEITMTPQQPNVNDPAYKKAMKEHDDMVTAYRKEEADKSKAIADGFSIMGEGLCTLLKIKDVKKKARLIAGYKALSSSFFPSQPPTPPFMYGGVVNVPQRPPSPPMSCCTTEEDGVVVTLDWYCLLSRTYKQEFFPAHKNCILYLYSGQEVDLDKEQTLSLLKYISALDQSGQLSSMNRSPRGLLDHPAVKALLEANDNGTT